MRLGELIEMLESARPQSVPRGFGHPHSWRGIYAELAFEPVTNTTVDQMLSLARSCIGATFEGYKGGDYTMDEYTEVHISYVGSPVDLTFKFYLELLLDIAPTT